VDKTNVRILRTELGGSYPSGCVLLHPEKKLPVTVQKKQSTPTKKLNFVKVALAAIEAEDHEQGGTGTLGKMSSPTTNLVVHVNSENVTRLNHGMPFGYLK
jgi:hypothetical protein